METVWDIPELRFKIIGNLPIRELVRLRLVSSRLKDDIDYLMEHKLGVFLSRILLDVEGNIDVDESTCNAFWGTDLKKNDLIFMIWKMDYLYIYLLRLNFSDKALKELCYICARACDNSNLILWCCMMIKIRNLALEKHRSCIIDCFREKTCEFIMTKDNACLNIIIQLLTVLSRDSNTSTSKVEGDIYINRLYHILLERNDQNNAKIICDVFRIEN